MKINLLVWTECFILETGHVLCAVPVCDFQHALCSLMQFTLVDVRQQIPDKPLICNSQNLTTIFPTRGQCFDSGIIELFLDMSCCILIAFIAFIAFIDLAG